MVHAMRRQSTFLFSTYLLVSLSLSHPTQAITLNHYQSLASRHPATNTAVVAYFDDSENDYRYSSTPVVNGFYRVLLGRDQHGRYRVQDLFYASAQKHTDPYWIKSFDGLALFDFEAIDGPIVGYYRNGQLSYKGSIKNGEVIDQYDNYYPNGMLANRYTTQGNLSTQQFFYQSGQKAALIYYRDHQIISQTAWDQHGQPIAEARVIDYIREQILEDLAIDQ
jgi:hypothetical protein